MLARVLKSAVILALVIVSTSSFLRLALTTDESWPLTAEGEHWLAVSEWVVGGWIACAILAVYWLSDWAKLKAPWNWTVAVSLAAVLVARMLWFPWPPLTWILTLSVTSLLIFAVVNAGRRSWRVLGMMALATACFGVSCFWLAEAIRAAYYMPAGG